MSTAYREQVIQHTREWVKQVVIGCGFCPFAYKVVEDNTIVYTVIEGAALHEHPEALMTALQRLDAHPAIETSLLIFPDAYESFGAYLTFLRQAEKTMRRKGYEGIYQLASFHPQYVFEASDENDPANYTNRSPYPMLHLLREESVGKAVAHIKDADSIPQRNIRYATQKGMDYMKGLLDNILKAG